MSKNEVSVDKTGTPPPSPLSPPPLEVDLSKPRHDLSTYGGRVRYFKETVSPLNALLSSSRLEQAKTLLKDYQSGRVSPGTTEEQLWEAKRLYNSAYHPDTGERMFFAGRMSFQVPGNMFITGCLLTFHKHPLAVTFWQFANQSYNSLVNYTNRSGNEIVTRRQILVPYMAASTMATATALVLNKIVAPRVPKLMGRLIPFVAIAAANAINIPLTRQRELRNGVPIYDRDHAHLGTSKAAAMKGIFEVTVSRILLATPVMVVPPITMHLLERKGFLKRFPMANAPMQILIVGLCFAIFTPYCCALFPQRSSISVTRLEEEVRVPLQQSHPTVNTAYFNKGL